MIVEQAVFTSARTQRLDGYQIVAASSGVSPEERKSLARWCPAHDSLAQPSPSATSINFHSLEGGNYCVSQTSIAGAEYSGRGGGRVFTRCFIVAPALLRKFSNNPFRVLEAIIASGRACGPDSVPVQIDPIQLNGSESTVDRDLLKRLIDRAGCGSLASVVGVAVREPSMCIVDDAHPELWLAALFSLLPVTCRTQLTFTTGLKLAGRRPFRALTRQRLSNRDQNRLERAGLTLVHTGQAAVNPAPSTGWAGLAERMLADGNFAPWERLLRCRLPGLELEHLDRLADQLLSRQPTGRCEVVAGQAMVR